MKRAVLLLALALSTLVAAWAGPVAAEKLMLLLPEPPEGWTAEEPVASTTDTEDFKISVAGRTYAMPAGDDDSEAPTVAVNITDSAGNAEYATASTAGWMDAEGGGTDEGFARKVEIAGRPGFETYDAATQTTVLSLRVRERFFVTVETVGLPPGDVRKWLARLDLARLEALR